MLLFLLLYLFRIGPNVAIDDAAFAKEFLSRVNTLRNTGCHCNGEYLAPASDVKWNSKLKLSSTLHAQQMMRYHFFDHYSRGGKDIGERVKAVGYSWATVGENLARGQVTIVEVIEDWLDSPTHCQVLMNPKFREMGAAHVGEYWVLHMGVRKE